MAQKDAFLASLPPAERASMARSRAIMERAKLDGDTSDDV